MPVVESAVRTGTPYIDSTGEAVFMAEVYRRFRDAGSAVVPACGFDYVPGDLGVAVAVEELGEAPEEVDVVYAISGVKLTRGTARSVVGALTVMRPHLIRLVVAGEHGPVTAVRLPWGEELTAPLHASRHARLRTGVAAPGWMTRVTQVVGPVAPYTAPLSRLAKPLMQRWADRLPEGPSDAERGRSEARTYSVVRAGSDHT